MSDLPLITTARLRLQRRTFSDLEDCLRMDRDPLVTKFITGPWHDPAAHRAFVQARIQADSPEGMGYWTIRNKTAPQAFLGWVMLLPYETDKLEIGWRLVRDSWGKGYATEAAQPVLDHAFKQFPGQAILADIHPDNQGSVKVAEKIGMAFTGLCDLGDGPALSYRA